MANEVSWYVQQSDPSYTARRQGIQNQINDIPGQLEAALAGLQNDYNRSMDTLNRQRTDYGNQASESAARRGMAWSNVSDAYRSNYEKNNFTPAVTSLNDALSSGKASVNESYTNRRRSLEDTLNALMDEQYQFAMSQRQADLDREFQASENAKARAATKIPYNFNSTTNNTSGNNQIFYDDWNGNYTRDANGWNDPETGIWHANGGEWAWDHIRNKWRLVSGNPEDIYNKVAFRNGQQLAGGLSNGGLSQIPSVNDSMYGRGNW
jgi:hypothetical protein